MSTSETRYYVMGAGEYSSVSGWVRVFVKVVGNKIEYSGSTKFYQSDHLGTPRVETSASGAVTGTWSAYPFGEEWESSGASGDQHRFTGHLRDGPTDMEYADARYYNGSTGRWTSVDPILGNPSNPQRLNRYAYAFNNPVNAVDPDGRDPIPTPDIIPGIPPPTTPPFVPAPLPPPPEWVYRIRPFLDGLETLRQAIAEAFSLFFFPVFRERISDECKQLFGDFIEAVRQDPSLIEDVHVPANRSPTGQAFVASAGLHTLEIALALIDAIRINRGFWEWAADWFGSSWWRYFLSLYFS